MKETSPRDNPRLIMTDYNHSYFEIPTRGFTLSQRLDWIKTLLAGGDIVYRPDRIQQIDLRAKKEELGNDSEDMP